MEHVREWRDELGINVKCSWDNTVLLYNLEFPLINKLELLETELKIKFVAVETLTDLVALPAFLSIVNPKGMENIQADYDDRIDYLFDFMLNYFGQTRLYLLFTDGISTTIPKNLQNFIIPTPSTFDKEILKNIILSCQKKLIEYEKNMETKFLTNIGKGANGPIYQALFLPVDNGFLFVGDFDEFDDQPANHIVRLNQDGSINHDFMNNIGEGPDARIHHAVRLPNNDIILAGNFANFNGQKLNYLVCLNNDGIINKVFMDNIGKGANDQIFHAEYYSDGENIILTGDFNQFNGFIASGIVRLNHDGTVDRDFLSYIGKGISGADDNFCRTLKLPGDQILLIGKFSEFNWNKTNNIILLDQNGMVNQPFLKNIGSGANGSMSSAFLLNDHNILLFGRFTKFNGSKANGVVSIGPEGLINEHFMDNLSIWSNDRITYALDLPDQSLFLFGNFDKRKNEKITGHVVHLKRDGSFYDDNQKHIINFDLENENIFIQQAIYLPDDSILIIVNFKNNGSNKFRNIVHCTQH